MIRFSSSIGQAIIAETQKPWLDETLLDFNFNGELNDEDEIILGDEEFGGLSAKDRYQKKDGLLACLLTTKAFTALRSDYSKQYLSLRLNAPYRLEFCKPVAYLASAVPANLVEKLSNSPKAINGRCREQIIHIDWIKPFEMARGNRHAPRVLSH
jgi:phosphomannomutase